MKPRDSTFQSPSSLVVERPQVGSRVRVLSAGAPGEFTYWTGVVTHDGPGRGLTIRYDDDGLEGVIVPELVQTIPDDKPARRSRAVAH